MSNRTRRRQVSLYSIWLFRFDAGEKVSAALSRSARALGAGIFTCCARNVTRSHAKNVGIKGRDDFITRLSRDTCNIVVIARPLYFYIPPMSLLKRANSPYNGISW